MEHYKLKSNLIVFTAIILSFIGCGAKPTEKKLELAFKKQDVLQAFSFIEYCDEKYDSIYFIYPYDDEEIIYSLPYKMSKRLRGYCSYTLDDTRVTTLLISKGEVKAYTDIPAIDAYFTNLVHLKQHLFPFDQKFIMDKERDVHLYNE